MDNWVELLRNNKKQNMTKQGFIMGVTVGGKQYSSSEYESIVKGENKDAIFINIGQEYEKLDEMIMLKLTRIDGVEYWEDNNGNRWTVSKYSETKAKEYSLTLTDCIKCVDCINSIGCMDCIECRNCIGCYDCTNCNLCTNCSHCTYCKNCINCSNCISCSTSTNETNKDNYKLRLKDDTRKNYELLKIQLVFSFFIILISVSAIVENIYYKLFYNYDISLIKMILYSVQLCMGILIIKLNSKKFEKYYSEDK